MKKELKEKEMNIVFILDKSGSMGGFEEDTIGGFNSFIETKKKENSNALVTTILFDNGYEVLHDRVPIKEVKKLTRKEYYVGGTTALYDAIGRTITDLDKSECDGKVLFVITTDGLENASRDYNKESVKKLIGKHSKWEFMYIGANIDSYNEGENIGIKRSNIANRETSGRGVGKMFSAISKAAKSLEMEDCIGESWKEELEDFIDNNKR